MTRSEREHPSNFVSIDNLGINKALCSSLATHTTQPVSQIVPSSSQCPDQAAVTSRHHGTESVDNRRWPVCHAPLIFASCLASYQASGCHSKHFQHRFIGLPGSSQIPQNERTRRLQWHMFEGAGDDDHTRDSRWILHVIVSRHLLFIATEKCPPS